MRTTSFSAGFPLTHLTSFNHVMSRYLGLSRPPIENEWKSCTAVVQTRLVSSISLSSTARRGAPHLLLVISSLHGPKLDFTHGTRTGSCGTSRSHHRRSPSVS